ncbi:MAG: hypothetical protein KGH71_01435 [Candidatus Micrarchaeota archaeon]|nr:hypothetical protein [Candidatus Micrarchaeota archaeon]
MIGLVLDIVKLLILAVVVAGIVVSLTFLTAPGNTVPASSTGLSDATVAQLKGTQLYRSLSSPNPISLSTLSPAGNSSSNYNATYSGTVSFTGSISGISVPLSFPVSVVSQKYANDSRIEMALSGVPLVGNLNLSLVKLNGTIYTCTPNNILSKNVTYECSQSPSSSSNALSLFTLTGSSMNVTITQLYPSSYNSVPCIYMNSTFSIPKEGADGIISSIALVGGSNKGPVSSINGTLSSCISPSDDLPLTLGMVLLVQQTNSSTSFKVSMVQVSNNQNVADSSIRALPGTLINPT